ncbi:hypothetical protein LCGC14_2509810, partial [marine sediment metagenome]
RRRRQPRPHAADAPLPNSWLLEDDDDTQSFVGHFQGALQSRYMLFTMEDTDAGPEFRVAPISRSYRFVKQSKHRALTLEEAEYEVLVCPRAHARGKCSVR